MKGVVGMVDDASVEASVSQPRDPFASENRMLHPVTIGSQNGLDLAAYLRAGADARTPTMSWQDLEDCYKQALAIRRREGRFRARLTFELGAVTRVATEERGGLPDSMVACIEDVVKGATYVSSHLVYFVFTVLFVYEPPTRDASAGVTP